MSKLCILFDPSHPEGAWEMYKECLRNKELIDEKCELWVGCTESSFPLVNYWLDLLRKGGFNDRRVFAGRLDHALCTNHATHIMRPKLLNYTKKLTHIHTQMGKTITDLSSLLYKNRPELLDYGYLVLGPESSVGRKIGASKIDDKTALRSIKSYVENNPGCYGVYIEGGSGARESVAERADLLEEMVDIMPKDKIIHAGGGITKRDEIERLIDIGIQRPVVGTHFERKPENIALFASVL